MGGQVVQDHHVAGLRVGASTCSAWDELRRVEIKLALKPALPSGEHVFPVLLGGVSRLFDRVVLASEEAPQRADPGRHTLLLAKTRLHLLQGESPVASTRPSR